MSEQRNTKPKVEEIASEYVDGEALSNLLDFVKWLRANRMTPTFAYKNEEGANYTSRVCYLKLRNDSWHIWPAGRKQEYVCDFLICEELKELVSAGLPPCNKECRHQCNSGLGHIITVCGVNFEDKCNWSPIRFQNPDTETLKIIKKIIGEKNNE